MTNENNTENQEKKDLNEHNSQEKKVVIDIEKEGFVSDSKTQSEQIKDENSVPKKKRKIGEILKFDEIGNIFRRTKEQNKNVKIYAILGVIFSILAVGLVYPCFYGGLGLFNYIIGGFFTNFSLAMGGNIVLILLLGLILVVFLGTIAIVLFLLPVALALFSLILPIFQLIVNRKWWGWVALAFGISAIPLCILIMSVLFKVL
ncbi:MAG: hypothetical protein EOM55_03985 [Clostridia bacterium]|nr:hypothetical protein [Clostridia bacterium]